MCHVTWLSIHQCYPMWWIILFLFQQYGKDGDWVLWRAALLCPRRFLCWWPGVPSFKKGASLFFHECPRAAIRMTKVEIWGCRGFPSPAPAISFASFQVSQVLEWGKLLIFLWYLGIAKSEGRADGVCNEVVKYYTPYFVHDKQYPVLPMDKEESVRGE